ncbi:MAG: IS1380 family transposase [Gammaproteobacteria bacterium]|nr:IS1380 family transposase [Gammaproteobacteria bacterium]
MKRFKIDQSNADIISHSGFALIGQAVSRYTNLSGELNTQVPLRHGIKHADVINSYLGLMCLGKNDFEAINTVESELFFTSSLGITDIPSEATLRQRMDNNAEAFLPIIHKASCDFLKNMRPNLEPLSTGHIPLDADVTPMDNSGSCKQGVSRTYKGCDGFAPMPAYLGQEGYCIEFELREGKQHCQKETPALLRRALETASKITELPLLLRLDSGNDAIENIDTILDFNERHAKRPPADFIIKWNRRKEDKEEWLAYAERNGRWEQPREGKRVAVFSIQHQRQWRGHEYSVRRVMRVTERTIDKHGQLLLAPEIELEGWWTSLLLDEEDVIQLYADHGTSEQFHSEFKTDLDMERLPSGKFATNALILAVSMLAYNLLRWIGQNGLLGPHSPKRSKAKRRRIKTVIQELMYLAARVVKTARAIKLVFGKGCRAMDAFAHVFNKLAYD